MTKLHLTLGVAALVGLGFFAGRMAAPQAAVAQEGHGGGAPHGAPRKLDRPHDVVCTMYVGENKPLEKVNISGALTFDIEKVGDDEVFLRLSNQAGKLWYIALDRCTTVEATPIGGGAVAPK